MAESNASTETLVGWFWSPEASSEKLPGRLVAKPNGEMTLEVINQVDSLDSDVEMARMTRMPIHGARSWHLGGKHGRLAGVVSGKTASGRTVTDTEITLDDCHLLTSGWLTQPRHIAFIVNRAYIGVALQCDEELQCSRASWIAEGIEGWLNPAGPTAAGTESLRHPQISVKTGARVEGLGKVEVTMGLLGGFSREKGNTYEIRESGYAALTLERQVSWDRASDGVYHAHRFLRFALDRLCAVKQLTVDTDGGSVEIVEQGMRTAGEAPYRPGQVRFDALFTANPKEGGVVGDPARVLRRWLELPLAAQGTLIRLHGLMQSDQFVDSQAVSACGAAELWYTQMLSDEDGADPPPVDPPPQVVKDGIARLLDENGWAELYGRRIKDLLQPLDEQSTGSKVRRTFDPIEREVMGLTGKEKCEVSAGLLRLRHPWSHGGVPADINLGSVSKLVRKARALLKLRVLEYLGVDWQAVARYNKTLQWELGLDEKWHSVPYPVYKNVSGLEACLSYLRRARGWRTLGEIATALTGGGWHTASKNPERVVSNNLTAYMKSGGALERCRLRGKVHWQVSEGAGG